MTMSMAGVAQIEIPIYALVDQIYNNTEYINLRLWTIVSS